jgi:AcrR family transcriptional regulator
MPHQTSAPRAKRSDAERNRERILAAARPAFADPEAEISMAEISRRADVGMATLYRNFPGRRELLEALFIDEVDAVCEAADTIEADTPGAVFEAWLHCFFQFFNSKRHVGSELLGRTSDPNPVLSQSRRRVLAAGRPLLAAAQRSHEVRDELTLEQILDMIKGIATIDGDPAYLEPILETALSGLHPTPAGKLEASRRRPGVPPAPKSSPTSQGPSAGSRRSSRRANATASAANRPRHQDN